MPILSFLTLYWNLWRMNRRMRDVPALTLPSPLEKLNGCCDTPTTNPPTSAEEFFTFPFTVGKSLPVTLLCWNNTIHGVKYNLPSYGGKSSACRTYAGAQIFESYGTRDLWTIHDAGWKRLDNTLYAAITGDMEHFTFTTLAYHQNPSTMKPGPKIE